MVPLVPRPSLERSALDRLRRTMGSEAEYHGMLNEFLGASGKLADELQAAVARGAQGDAERAAHTLKSMARMVGASELGAACASAEAQAAASRLQALDAREVAALVHGAQEAVRECLA